MKHDSKRRAGYYWVRFEGEVIVGEYIPRRSSGVPRRGCAWPCGHWHLTKSAACFADKEVCELLAGPLDPFAGGSK